MLIKKFLRVLSAITKSTLNLDCYYKGLVIRSERTENCPSPNEPVTGRSGW